MNDDSYSSGFVRGEEQANESFSARTQCIYTSESGYTQLFRCERMGKFIILKSLKPIYRGTDFYEKALEKEFNIGYQLDHPNICRTLSWEDIPSKGHCIVMDYVDGITLKELMEKGKLTLPLATKIITELCGALQYLHSKQIIHRDLKPSNILITYNGNNVKLIDFSLSDCDDYNILKLPAGTRFYLAPEALQSGIQLDNRADIYSLGVIIGEMANQLNSKRLERISRICIRRKRENRYASANEIVKALNTPSRKPLYIGMVSAVCGLMLMGSLYYAMLENGNKFSEFYPVYGNQVGSEECLRLLASERFRLQHMAEPLTSEQWKADSTSLVRRMQAAFDKEYPLPELRESSVYKHRWESVLRETVRQLKEIRTAHP